MPEQIWSVISREIFGAVKRYLDKMIKPDGGYRKEISYKGFSFRWCNRIDRHIRSIPSPTLNQKAWMNEIRRMKYKRTDGPLGALKKDILQITNVWMIELLHQANFVTWTRWTLHDHFRDKGLSRLTMDQMEDLGKTTLPKQQTSVIVLREASWTSWCRRIAKVICWCKPLSAIELWWICQEKFTVD